MKSDLEEGMSGNHKCGCSVGVDVISEGEGALSRDSSLSPVLKLQNNPKLQNNFKMFT